MHQELNKNLGKKEWGKMHEQQHKEGKMPQSRPLEVGLISRAGSLRLPVSHTHTQNSVASGLASSTQVLGAAFSLI